jgi:hypothetical protein
MSGTRLLFVVRLIPIGRSQYPPDSLIGHLRLQVDPNAGDYDVERV